MSTSKNIKLKISISAVFLAFSGWKSNFEGGDISLARKSYLVRKLMVNQLELLDIWQFFHFMEQKWSPQVKVAW
jgi:hypothetical protein